MTAEPNGPSLPPADPRRMRTWLHGVSIALVPILASGAIWLAYEQGSQDRELAAISTKIDTVSVHAAMDTAHVDDRAHRIRDDFDSYKLSVQADLITMAIGQEAFSLGTSVANMHALSLTLRAGPSTAAWLQGGSY